MGPQPLSQNPCYHSKAPYPFGTPTIPQAAAYPARYSTCFLRDLRHSRRLQLFLKTRYTIGRLLSLTTYLIARDRLMPWDLIHPSVFPLFRETLHISIPRDPTYPTGSHLIHKPPFIPRDPTYSLGSPFLGVPLLSNRATTYSLGPIYLLALDKDINDGFSKENGTWIVSGRINTSKYKK